MKIWLDTMAMSRSITGRCEDDDCDGECFCNYDQSWRESIPFSNINYIHNITLKQALPLHIQQCAQERWIVCNPTGAGQIVVLDQQAYTLFEQFRSPNSLKVAKRASQGGSPDLAEEIVILLYKMGLLQPDNHVPVKPGIDELETLSAWLHVTNACNLRCNYCYLEKSSERMSDDTALRAVDAVFRSAIRHRFKRVKLKYAGGEASLHMSNVIAIHDYAVQQAQHYDMMLRATILSNGVVLSQRAIDQLKSRQIGVMISLDGIGLYHDRQRPFIHGQASFRYVDRTISRLLENGIVPHISVTVSLRNLNGLPDVITYILERDMTFTLNYYRENDYAIGDDLQFDEQQMIAAMRYVFAMLEHKLPSRSFLGSLIDKSNLNGPHLRTCAVGQNYLVIDQHGGVAKCQADIKHTVATIRDDDPLHLIRNDRSGVQGLSVEEKEGCKHCEWRYWCAGGCPLLTYRKTGRYDVKSPNCNIYTALFPEVIRLEALRLLKYMDPIITE